jgi:O-methyltransferase involved in polyketide biosynthesis
MAIKPLALVLAKTATLVAVARASLAAQAQPAGIDPEAQRLAQGVDRLSRGP